ncbi:MAG TPA: serine hydrolase [Candidatus Dormibacteraeota bacterium]|nr:serine hydrolase [Candidatus Dormibacteraeota bacterium]
MPSSYRSSKTASYSKIKLRVLICLLLIVITGSYILWTKHAAAEAAVVRQAQIQAAAVAAKKADIFAGQVDQLMSANPTITFSISTVNSSQGLKVFGTEAAFDGASTAKLLTAADYLNHVQLKSTSLKQNIDGNSGQYWLKEMLVNSDDTAWTELNDYLTHPDLKRYANSIGFTNYDPSTNSFTSSDVARLLAKLSDGSLLWPANRSLMLNYLSQANYRDYIVPAVSSGDKVYHKAGEDDDDVHDAAIITSGSKSFVLVIFSDGNGTYDWVGRATLMQTITKDAIAAYL